MLRSLYETDFHQRTLLTVQMVKDRRFDELDLEHLAEAIEDIGKSERQAIESQVERLLHHLLKWQYQPGYRGSSWKGSIQETRKQISKQIRRNPSLKGYPAQVLADAYEIRRVRAIAETGLSEETFPLACHYSVDQVLAEQFFPES